MFKTNRRHHRLDRHGAGLRRRRDPLPHARLGPLRVLGRVGRPGLRPRLHAQPVARHRPAFRRRQTRSARCRGEHRSSCSASSSRSTTSARAQNKRWDLTNARQFTLSDQTQQRAAEARRAAEDHGLRPHERFRRYKDRAAEYPYVSKQVSVEYVDPDRDPAPRQAVPGADLRHGRVRVQGPHRARRRRHRAGPHQRHHQGGHRRAEEGLLRRGPRRARHGSDRADRLQLDGRASSARTTAWTSWRSCSRATCPRTRRWSSSPVRRSISWRPRWTRSGAICRRAASSCCCSTRPTRPTARRSPT